MAEGESRSVSAEASARATSSASAEPTSAFPIAPVGKITQYTQGSDWENYVEQLDFFFIANNVRDPSRKKAILMANIPAETYQVIKDLLAPAAPSDEAVTYTKVVEVMKQHVKPEKSALVCRYEFDNRVRKPGESVADYVKALKHLAIDCKFSDGMRNERLRDRFIAGIHNDRMLRLLLAEKLTELTFDRAVQRCVAIEQASRDIEALHGSESIPTHPANEDKVDTTVCQVQVDTGRKCYRCNGNHAPFKCPFKTATCHGCGKRGHVRQACRNPVKGSETKANQKKTTSKGKTTQRKVNALDTHHSQFYDESEDATDSDSNSNVPLHSLFHLKGTRPIKVDVVIESEAMTMELDTGAAVSIVSKSEYDDRLNKHVRLQETPLRLHTYTGETIRPVGVCTVDVRYDGQVKRLPLYVVKGAGPALFGRDWLDKIRLQWPLLHVETKQSLKEVLERHTDVFSPGLGRLKGIQARIALKRGSQPRFWKARPVALARRAAVDMELGRLEKEGLIQPVPYSEWAAPIVTPIKKDGAVRICGDFKVTVNPQLDVESYPLPRIDDIFASLRGGRHFSVLDLRQAYLQMELDEQSKPYMTVNTQKGLYQYQRLPYGVASAPAIWQRAMDQVLQGIPNVQCYLDDIIVTGRTMEEHLETLDRVLERLQTYGLKANQEKCKFLQDSVEYCGHVISSKGLHQSSRKVQAITEMPRPQNVTQLKSFLGMVQYYAKFLPNLASQLGPLYQLLRKGTPWAWKTEQEDCFLAVKNMLVQDRILTHFNPDFPMTLSCDSSSYGLGAVLSHRLPDGSERPIAYASRSLTKTEEQYAQIEREALALFWGVRKFQLYLEGRPFVLITDHKPLKYIMDPGKAVPVTAAARLQRWCLFLGAFHYTIEHRSTQKHANCDALSRLPLNTEQGSGDEVDEVALFYSSIIDTLPITAKDIRKATRTDPVLSQVTARIQEGWQDDQSGNDLKPYFHRRGELTMHQGVLMWGARVIIPSKLRAPILETLHEGHSGMVKMKGLARSFVWWPLIDQDIEHMARHCQGCQETASNPKRAPIHVWEYPSSPWQRLHVDFAGPLFGKMYLVLVDAYSKWPEIIEMRTTTAEETVAQIRTIFARMGIPQQLVSDNGPQFTSETFKIFMKKNGIKHVTGAPYHPATNGIAERLVRSFKRAVKADRTDITSQHKLDKFLLSYRIAPHATTDLSPGELLFGRNIRTRLDLTKPDVQRTVENQTLRNEHRPFRSFHEGQSVLVKNHRQGPPWLKGTIQEQTGPVSYRVLVEQTIRRQHADQLRSGAMAEEITLPEAESTTGLATAGSSTGSAWPPSTTSATPLVSSTIHLDTSKTAQQSQETELQAQAGPFTTAEQPETFAADTLPKVDRPDHASPLCTRAGRKIVIPSKLRDYVMTLETLV